MNDLRTPIGIFFALIGVILAVTPATGAALTDVPVNLYTGAAALAFGVFMLLLARRGSRRASGK